jgi:flagellin
MDIHAAERTDTEASLSTIQDADLASEQLELTKLQILQQSALAMLAQANAAPQAILMLFGA